MAAKLRGNFFVLLWAAFNVSITGHLISIKISVNFVVMLSFHAIFGRFCENFENTRELILNCPRVHAITYTYCEAKNSY